jgi:hypothetical protein
MFLETFLIQNKLSRYCTGLKSNMLRAEPYFVDVKDESSLCLFKQCTVEVRRGVETVSTRTLISVLNGIG